MGFPLNKRSMFLHKNRRGIGAVGSELLRSMEFCSTMGGDISEPGFGSVETLVESNDFLKNDSCQCPCKRRKLTVHVHKMGGDGGDSFRAQTPVFVDGDLHS